MKSLKIKCVNKRLFIDLLFSKKFNLNNVICILLYVLVK